MTDQLEKPPRPPVSQSKPALEHNPDDEDEAPKINYDELYNSKELLKGCDPILRWAAGDVLAKKVEDWAANWTSGSEEKLKAHIGSEDTRNEFKELLKSRYLERRVQETSDPPNERVLTAIEEQITKYLPELIAATVQAAVKKGTEPRNEMNAEEKEREYQHILWKMRKKSNLYELLGVDYNAPPEEVNQAYKKLVLLTHPDKNSDEHAGECTSELTRARNTLMDSSGRAAYHRFVKDNRAPDKVQAEWGEEFAPNAWGEEDEADLFVSEDEDEESYPKPDSSASAILHKFDDTFRQYFQSEGPDKNLRVEETIKEVNKELRAANKSAGRDPELYFVRSSNVLTMRYFQQRVLTYYKLDLLSPETAEKATAAATKEIQFLSTYCRKVCEQPKHQWPLQWVDLVVRPLKYQLRKDGWEDKESGTSSGGNETSGSKGTGAREENDTEMPDVGDSKPPQTYVPSKPLKSLQPGLTAHGERILGYLPVYRRFRAANTTVITSFKLFFETKERQRLGFTDSADPAALAYHNFDKRNHIREPKIDWYALRFKSIKGIAFKSPVMTGGRIPDGYLWVDVFDNPQAGKEYLLTRSEFQHWVTTKAANEYIDSFFCEHNLTPPWAPGIDPATSVTTGYVLRYALPNAKQRGLMPYTHEPGNQAAEVQEIKGLLEKLCLTIEEDRKSRKEEVDGMMKLLGPASK